jgi:O-antigen ligase
VNTLAQSHAGAAQEDLTERSARRRIGAVWTLLFFNVLAYVPGLAVINVSDTAGKLMTQASLWMALVLALSVNRRAVIRPNMFLFIFTLLAALSLLSTLDTLHFGSIYRAFRLLGFLSTLWLLTPWWGRSDLLILRNQFRCLMGIVIVSAIGIVISPGKALGSGRLVGAVWPVVSPQLAHYAAVAGGLATVLWFCHLISRNRALVLGSISAVILILTHTRTALVAMVVGILVAGLSLFLTRRRVRRALAVVLVTGAVVAVAFAPVLSHWFERGESGTSFTDLSGRTVVWHALVNAPRTKSQTLFGFGLSNDSFQGLSIDSSWLAVYETQGLVGDILVGLSLLVLLGIALTRARGPTRALALFIITYCLIASYTEVGLGDASTYILDLAVAASLLVTSASTSDLQHPLTS